MLLRGNAILNGNACSVSSTAGIAAGHVLGACKLAVICPELSDTACWGLEGLGSGRVVGTPLFAQRYRGHVCACVGGEVAVCILLFLSLHCTWQSFPDALGSRAACSLVLWVLFALLFRKKACTQHRCLFVSMPGGKGLNNKG